MKTRKYNNFLFFLILIIPILSISFSYAEEPMLNDPIALLLKQHDKKSKCHKKLFTSYLQRQIEDSYKDQSKDVYKNKALTRQVILIDAIAIDKDPKKLIQDLLDLGLHSYAVNGRFISGFLPVSALYKLDNLDSLNEIKPSLNSTSSVSQGLIVSQGDKAQQSDLARQNYNVNGKNIKIGVISDSFNCLNGEKEDKKTKDLPKITNIIEDAIDCRGTTDEGRALMQIVHDIAPGAQLLFFSSSNGLAKTANGILDMAFKHNVDIIIDDYKSLSASFFQEDPLSQAVKRVVKAGVTYITAAGNSGRNSYQSSYNEFVSMPLQLNAHDFDPGPDIDIYQRLNVPEGVGFRLALQWDSPAYSISGKPGAQTDLDIFIFNKQHTEVLASSTFGNIGRDPIEVIQFFNPPDSGQTEFDLMISKASGLSPNSIKYIILNSIEGIISEHQTNSSAIFGHANSRLAITVGAASYLHTAAFGSSTTLLQSYSSAGGTKLVFDLNGNYMTNASAPLKPDVIAPDNVNTTFFGDIDTDNDGKPNISGTSAAAPHAAGVAALLLEKNPKLQPQDIKKILQETAVDIILRKHEDTTKTPLETGFDFDSGYGLINAEAAVGLASTFQASPPAETGNNNSGGVIIINDSSQSSGGGTINCFCLLLLIILVLNRKQLRLCR